MVDEITPTHAVVSKGVTPAVIVTFAGFDGDAEFGIFDAWDKFIPFTPRTAVALVTTVAGTTAAIDVDVDVSMDGSTFVQTNINNITADDTHALHPNPDYGEPDTTHLTRWRYWKVLVNTVGAGNTLTLTLWLTE